MKIKPCMIQLNGEDVYFDVQNDNTYRISHRRSANSVEIYPKEYHLVMKHYYWNGGQKLFDFFKEVEEYYFDIVEW